jgi:hypothetical protein
VRCVRDSESRALCGGALGWGTGSRCWVIEGGGGGESWGGEASGGLDLRA